MFELDDKIVEAIIFAMENQESESFVDVETGELVSRAGDINKEGSFGAEEPARFEPIPEWTSQDGFRLMEQFAQTIGHPVVRTDLLGALARGRGVFRAFKNALDAHPEAEKKWYEYKSRAMKARIVDWYEKLRDARGLERLGLEPEDTDDLLLSDFQIQRYDAESWGIFADCLRICREDALSRFPQAFVEYEFALLDREIAENGDEFSIYSAECEPGSYAGVAMVRTLTVADRTFSKLVFLYVDPARRRIGLGHRLAEFARERAVRAGIRYFILDIPFLWEEFGTSLQKLGYAPFGTRWIAVSTS